MTRGFMNRSGKIYLEERNHVEKPLMGQLASLGWEILDLDNKQHTAVNEVIMPSDSLQRSTPGWRAIRWKRWSSGLRRALRTHCEPQKPF